VQAVGIDPSRIEFVDRQPRDRYLQTFNSIDISLDTFPYNGHTTSLDSFWMGTPVVTLIGQTVVGRAGWSIACNLDVRELAAKTQPEFVQIAASLASNLPKLEAMRSSMRSKMQHSPLMDGKKFTEGLEQAYRGMWRRFCRPTL
jgi:predicted O-linked N-acetylglucosamine transferase (SPINDLY family)